MPRRVFRIREGEPSLDIVSYGRGGPRENGGRLTPEQIDHIRRTVQRVPEVMVKVLPRASNDLSAVGKHLDYINRYGRLPLETDDGERMEGLRGQALLEEWDVDIDDVRRQATLAGTKGKKSPKLVHKLMFSMPAGTEPGKVLAAVRNVAREQFWGQHRYAFVLHTDEDHPHVHLVLKAVSEEGARLNIRKATLRYWRSEFGRNLRLLGVPANATERAVRGEYRKAKKDGVYRAALRGDSSHMRTQADSAASSLTTGKFRVEPGNCRVLETRTRIDDSWRKISRNLASEGRHDLASDVRRFAQSMLPARTERELLAVSILERVRHDRAHQTLSLQP
jgi:hypothetical protein